MSVEIGPERTGGPPVGSRRQRQRQETFREIVTTARRLLGTPDGLSLRSVAAEMGMTPPALYRYVDSYQDLQVLVARDIMTDLVELLWRIRRSVSDEDPAMQITLVSLAFRNWSLVNHAEFSMAFANAELAVNAGDKSDSRNAMALVYIDIYRNLKAKYGFETPLPEGYDMALDSPDTEWPQVEDAGLAWAMTRHYVRLFGVVTLEVYRQLPPGLIESGALFRATLRDTATDLNLGPDIPRLAEAISERIHDPAFLDVGTD